MRSPTPWSSSVPTTRRTSMARCCPSTAAGSPSRPPPTYKETTTMTGPATPPAGGQDPAQGPSTPLSGTTQDPATSVSKLGYVEFTTPDLDRLTEYYTSALCFELVDRTADQAFLTTGFDHHCVVLNRGE